ncbi:hypothetical protein [Streptomyces cinereoruber]|uniref:hypothetical protein n=1 Tax=Streptomyces cinereoruber TaxID=67260 RepID=UPI003631676D
MTDTTGEHVDRGAPGVSPGAVWLREELLDIASAASPDRGPVVVREWTDSVRLRDPAPVGFRSLFLIGTGWAGRPPPSKFGEVLAAFAGAGWEVRRHASDRDGESRATARHEDFEVRVYEGSGSGLLTLTGWTPVVYPELPLSQPPFTLSTAPGVLCWDCHGWRICLDCEGRPYLRYKRCWCATNNAGAGMCVECAGLGFRSSEAASWRRPPQEPHDTDTEGAFPPVTVETGHDSTLRALTDVAQRACTCGEFRCSWRNSLSREGNRLLCRFGGTYQGCGVRRAYAFALPLP